MVNLAWFNTLPNANLIDLLASVSDHILIELCIEVKGSTSYTKVSF